MEKYINFINEKLMARVMHCPNCGGLSFGQKNIVMNPKNWPQKWMRKEGREKN